VSTTVIVETWGAFFVVATIAGPADNFPQKVHGDGSVLMMPEQLMTA